MSRNGKVALAVVAVLAVAVAAFVFYGRDDDPKPPESPTDALVRPDSPALSDGPDATFVEFVDFESEDCLAYFPGIEQLRADYGDRVTFVVRHLPLQNNSMNAALASEAAADQGRFEDMYQRLFETAHQWVRQEDSQSAFFEGLAAEMKLDMDRYRASVADPATTARIEQSVADGRSLGVKRTPAFYLNGHKLIPSSADDLRRDILQALGG